MPWIPELFSESVLEGVLEERRDDRLAAVPYYTGLLAGEPDALIESFAGEPQLFDPVRGRIRGVRAFTDYVADIAAWLAKRNVEVGDVERFTAEGRSFEEVRLHLDGRTGRVTIPVTILADHGPRNRLDELRVYHSGWAVTGIHVGRPPLLQGDPDVVVPDVVAAHQRALAAGDLDAIVDAFEPDGYVREPAGDEYLHRGPDGLRAFYGLQFSRGGIPLQHCALAGDERACALEYNVVRWGGTELPPQAGVAVFARGPSGKLAAVRMYDDVAQPAG